jgi:DHA2 family multidrug resistance protein
MSAQGINSASSPGARRDISVGGDGPIVDSIDKGRRAVLTLYVMLASLMQSIDTTIANVALPRIQGSLAATQDQMAWVLTSYIVAAAIMTPLSAWLAGRMGRRKIFLLSVGGFTVASILCGLAQSLPQMVLARLLQGLCGAALIPLSQALLLDINPPSDHPRAMAIWVMGVTVGPILGPTLGGWLTENYNWRWVFYINLPVGIFAFLGLLKSLPETKIRRTRFDFFGFAALSVALGALQLVLDRGQLKDWFSSTEICIEAAVAGLGFYLFIVHMLTTIHRPFISAALFKDRNFVTANLIIFTVGVVLYATLALLPPMLQDLLNYPVVTTGWATAPRGIGSMVALVVVGRAMGKIDNRLLIASGFVLTTFSMWQMTGFDLQMSVATVVWSGLAQGLGSGFILVPASSAAFYTLAPALRNEGAAMFGLVRNIGSSLGISIVETLLARNVQTVHSSLGEHVSLFNPILRAQLPTGTLTLHTIEQLNASLTRQATMVAYNDEFKLMMVLSLAALPLVLLLGKGRNQNVEQVTVK